MNETQNQEQFAKDIDFGDLIMNHVNKIGTAAVSDTQKYFNAIEFFRILLITERQKKIKYEMLNPEEQELIEQNPEIFGTVKEWNFDIFTRLCKVALEEEYGSSEENQIKVEMRYYNIMFQELFRIIRNRIPERKKLTVIPLSMEEAS